MVFYDLHVGSVAVSNLKNEAVGLLAFRISLQLQAIT